MAKIRIIIHSEFTTKDLYNHVKKLKRSPWSAEDRPYGGITFRHKQYTGSIGIRENKRLRSSERIYATALGSNAGVLAGKFVTWVFDHFGAKLIEITVKPSKTKTS